MKILILIGLVFVKSLEADNAQLASAQNEMVQKYTAECLKETGVEFIVVTETKAGHLSEDEGFKKFILCFFQKSGLLSSDAKLNTEVALSNAPQDLDKVTAEKLINKCMNETGKNNADTAFKIYKCFHKARK